MSETWEHVLFLMKIITVHGKDLASSFLGLKGTGESFLTGRAQGTELHTIELPTGRVQGKAK